MRRFAIGFVLFVAIAGLAALACSESVWDGQFPLVVTVVNDGPDAITTVRCEAFFHATEAQAVLDKTLAGEPSDWSAPAKSYSGQPLTVEVPVSGRSWIFGIETRRSQFQNLLIVVEYQSGKRSGKIAEIPDSRKSRSIIVVFPQ